MLGDLPGGLDDLPLSLTAGTAVAREAHHAAAWPLPHLDEL